MIDRDWVVAVIEAYPNIIRKNKFEPSLDVYWLTAVGTDPVMVALLSDHAIARLSLRADPVLSQKLRNDYESVSAGQKLDQRDWNTILLTGQLSRDQIGDLIGHSYDLARALIEKEV